MKLTTEFNKKELNSIYFEKREYLLPVFAIFVSFFLFFIFIVPQILSFPQRKGEIDVENAKLSKIKETEKILSSANKSLIESQFKIASKALPPAKPFEEVLSGITTAATLSNSQIDSYQFEEQEILQAEPSKFSSLIFQVTIIGGIEQAIEFVSQINKTYPIAEVNKITSSFGTSTISIVFYYKAFPSIDSEDRTQIRSLSAEEKSALDQISKWNETTTEDVFELQPDASASGDTSSPF